MEIRGLTAADCPEVLSLWARAGLAVDVEGRDSSDSLQEQLETFSETYLVAEDDGRIVGVALGTHDGRKGWINRLAVDPAHRRRGVAEALVREI